MSLITVGFSNDTDGAELLDCMEHYNMILSSHDVALPAPRLEFVTVEGHDGSLDLSDWTGDTQYDDRTIAMSFSYLNDFGDDQFAIDRFCNDLHGRKKRIVFSNDPNHYFLGRITIANKTDMGASQQIDVSVTCGPFRHDISLSKYVVTKKAIIPNGRMLVVPSLKVDGNSRIQFLGKSISISAGEYRRRDVYFTQGLNTIEVLEGGPLTVTFRGGDL